MVTEYKKKMKTRVVRWKFIPILFENSGSYRREKTEKPKPDQYKTDLKNLYMSMKKKRIYKKEISPSKEYGHTGPKKGNDQCFSCS